MAKRSALPIPALAYSPVEKLDRGQDLKELGVTGLKRYGLKSQIYEEFLTDLRGERAAKIFQEMLWNDSVIGAIQYVIEMVLRNTTWRVDGTDKQSVEFVEGCVADMSHTWEEFLSEVLSMLPFGYSFHEVIYKRRMGESNDPRKNSKFDDGQIGWRKFPIRSQDTLFEWEFDEEGGTQAFVQLGPPKYITTPIPISRGLLFRTRQYKGSPEGWSLLRNVYRLWYFKRRFEEIEAIGVERDLAGIPVIYTSGEVAASRLPNGTTYMDEFKKILRNVRRDEQEGLIMPAVFDEKGNKLCWIELLSSAGSRQHDVGKIIDRINRLMATTVVADFLFLGQQAVGSWALSSSKTDVFGLALNSINKSIASVVNRYAIPGLWRMNPTFKKENMPQLVPSDIETPDLNELGNLIKNLSGSGMPLFPDDNLENWIRQLQKWPEKSKDLAALQQVQRQRDDRKFENEQKQFEAPDETDDEDIPDEEVDNED